VNILTKVGRISTTPTRWKYQYFSSRGNSWRAYPQAEKIYNQLLAADPLTEEAIIKITGNSSWTYLECDECQRPSMAIAEFENSSHIVQLCLTCVSTAAKELKEIEEKYGTKN
jgi:hypothetical protein